VVLDYRFSGLVDQVQNFVVEFLFQLSTQICSALVDLYSGLKLHANLLGG